MASTTVKIDQESRKLLDEVSRDSKRKLSELLSAAIKKLHREWFWQKVDDAYDRLQADPKAWKEYRDEFKAWESVPGPALADETEIWAKLYPEAFPEQSAPAARRGKK